MRIINNPKRDDWPELLQRPAADIVEIASAVREILERVRTGGDDALRSLTREYDGVDLADLRVGPAEFDHAVARIPKELADAIELARANIEKFHAAQREPLEMIETTPGVKCWRRSVPIDRVGLYVPAGAAPLFSTVLMLGVPSALAGCRDIAICTPPLADGRAADAILFAAKVCGISTVYKIGGAQAIAAMAYGTETVAPVDKIFGPGNIWVTVAKQLVSTDVAIDMPAGPSEVAVLADRSCNPAFVAADLLSQAEHGPDSQVLLVTSDKSIVIRTIEELESQLAQLPRRETARAVLSNSKAIIVEDDETGMDLINEYAPEHLILAVENPQAAAEKVRNAGSVFLGNYSCETIGDYASGTNHTLPTAGFARSFSGVSLDSFMKKITFQEVSKAGLQAIGPAVEIMAAAEGLDAHKRAVTLRLEAINEFRSRSAG